MSQERQRLLILSEGTQDKQSIADALSPFYEIDICNDYEEALERLKKNEYQCILSDVGDFLPLERAIIDQRAGMILNTIGEGVCVVSDRGDCIWANQKLKRFPTEVYERVKQACGSAYSMFTAQTSESQKGNEQNTQSKKFGFKVNDGKYFEAMVSPVRHEGRVKQMVAVVWDASSGRRLQQKIDAIDSAGKELVRLESEAIAKLHVAERLALLEGKIIKYSRDLMNFDHFCVRMLDKKTNKLELVMSQGLPQGALDIDIYAEPEGNGISGYVAATGRSYICHDVERDPRYLHGLDHAKSSLTVPLRIHDNIIGVFNIESQTAGSFNEDDRQFAEIFGRYIAFAMNMLDLLVVERFMATERITENVLEGVKTPLEHIVSEAEALKENFVGNDELRRGLEIILSQVDCVKNVVNEVTAGRKTILGVNDLDENEHQIFKGLEVLVADDEAAIREQLFEVMGKVGAKVTVAKDGREALAMVDMYDFDLILSDIRMPHRTGYDIFAFSKRKNPMTPVILMTGFGYDPGHQIVRANKEGLQGVLLKPFEVCLLMEVLTDALNPEKSTGGVPKQDASAEQS